MSYYRVNVFARSLYSRVWFIEELLDIAIDGRDAA
jgi:hypothetical protein